MRGKRAPLIAGAAVAGVLLLVLMVLVFPKMAAVTEAQDRYDAAQAEQTTLTIRRESLEVAKEEAPANRATIEQVQEQLPELADEPGLLLLLHNAAEDAGLEVASFGVGQPTFDTTTGLSVIAVTVSAEGTYFEIADFFYNIETLPRAAKMTGSQLAPVESTGSVPSLSLSGTLELYTTDASAGSGSIPGSQAPPGGEG